MVSRTIHYSLFTNKNVHLTVLTIKLKTEAATVAQYKREGLAPRRTLPTVLHTIAQRIADAMTALHDGTRTALQFVGRQLVGTIEIACEVVGNVIEVFKLRT